MNKITSMLFILITSVPLFTIEPLDKYLEIADEIIESLKEEDVLSIDFTEYSSEGGFLKYYSDDDRLYILSMAGSMGKIQIKYFKTFNGVFIKEFETLYDMPFYMEESKIIEENETFYFIEGNSLYLYKNKTWKLDNSTYLLDRLKNIRDIFLDK